MALTIAGTSSAHDRYLCSGALVAPSLVVTAAHCLYVETGLQPASRFAVVTGRTRLSSGDGSEVAVKAYRLLPGFDYGSRRRDVAVLELASRARGTPIRIAGRDERRLWRSGATAYVTGWGQLGPDGPFPDVLRVARVRIVTDAECAARYPGQFLPEDMLCAGRPRRDACRLDSGGPLVVRAPDGGYRLVGDVSWGANPCGSAPGVYGRLAGGRIAATLRNLIRAGGVQDT